MSAVILMKRSDKCSTVMSGDWRSKQLLIEAVGMAGFEAGRRWKLSGTEANEDAPNDFLSADGINFPRLKGTAEHGTGWQTTKSRNRRVRRLHAVANYLPDPGQ